MSVLERGGRSRATRSRRGRRALRLALVVLGAVLVFLLGIAFARTLDERPRRGDPVTTVRTLSPQPQLAPSSTVTVTVTVP